MIINDLNVFSLSMMDVSLYFAIFIICFTWLLWRYITYPKNLPPGPIGLPFFGYLLFLGKSPHILLTDLKKKYGDVFSFGGIKKYVIVLASYKSIKEALIDQADAFSARPDFDGLPKLSSTLGIISNSGEVWSEFRRFSLSTLKDFGVGKTALEPQIQDEINYFIEKLKSLNGKAAYIDNFIHTSVTNVICIIMRGHRYDYDDEKFQELLHLGRNYLSHVGLNKLYNIWPFTLLKYFIKLDTAETFGNNLYKYFETYVENYEGDTGYSFIDAWLNGCNNAKNKNMTKNQLPRILMDLFIAGSDTTATTLRWSLLYMAQYPEIQKKVQQEIDNVIGRERSPSMSDQRQMPYTEATIMEINRIVTIVPLSVPHLVSRDTTLKGFFIPEGCRVVVHLWAVHHDPELFPEPFAFKPERFLNASNELKRMDTVIPFSLGKRQCMGESLARMELFLYFSSMLQNFTFSKEGDDNPNFDTHFGAVLEPYSQKLQAKPR